jgi:hypothetical protein
MVINSPVEMWYILYVVFFQNEAALSITYYLTALLSHKDTYLHYGIAAVLLSFYLYTNSRMIWITNGTIIFVLMLSRIVHNTIR